MSASVDPRRPIDRRALLQGAAALWAAAVLPARADAVAPAFLAVGDWGRRGDRDQTRVAEAMARAAAEVGSRFVISAGDNFYPAGVQSAFDPHWKASFEDVYAATSLQTPWYAALGNHDYRGRPSAQLDYARSSSRWRMPQRHYRVGAVSGVADLDLFVLDTTPITGDYGETVTRLSRGRFHMPDPDPQLAWFEAELARSRARWKVVVGHHPIHSGGRHGGSPELVARVEPLLARHGVQLYICGHDHALQHVQAGRTHHVCTGAGSSAGEVERVGGTLYARAEPGFAVFRVGAEAIGLEFRSADGTMLYEAALSA